MDVPLADRTVETPLSEGFCKLFVSSSGRVLTKVPESCIESAEYIIQVAVVAVDAAGKMVVSNMMRPLQKDKNGKEIEIGLTKLEVVPIASPVDLRDAVFGDVCPKEYAMAKLHIKQP
mmetsp:Transcript_29204/g.53328  ORF Transcript_29204/g.53328 Transcript_29204/m.53328 type:complete len:118 (-) Transcript_29204:251-604(-)